MTLEDIEVVFESIRPSLQADGGDAELVEITSDNMLLIRLLGNCQGCMYSTMTVKMGIERYLTQYFPELTSVEVIE
ncbi:MAG: NifU family protein [Spirochaetia bacterium]